MSHGQQLLEIQMCNESKEFLARIACTESRGSITRALVLSRQHEQCSLPVLMSAAPDLRLGLKTIVCHKLRDLLYIQYFCSYRNIKIWL